MLEIDDNLKQEVIDRLECPIVLIGLMGAGKTRLGRMLADALGLDFVDCDEEIEKSARSSVSEIFERYGEQAFRDGEHKVIKRLIGEGVRVISTGGGAVMTEATASLVWEKSISVWIRADIETTLERVTRNIEKRPVLAVGEPREILEKLTEKRYPVYEKADIVIDSGQDEEDKAVYKAVKELYTLLCDK